VSPQEGRETISPRREAGPWGERRRILCGRDGEAETAPSKLIAQLVELVLADFAPETERVFASGHRGVIEELECAVLVFERSVRAVPNARVVRNPYRRNTPGNGI